MEEIKNDASHGVLSDMAKDDVEQPGDTPSKGVSNSVNSEKGETEDAPRESD